MQSLHFIRRQNRSTDAGSFTAIFIRIFKSQHQRFWIVCLAEPDSELVFEVEKSPCDCLIQNRHGPEHYRGAACQRINKGAYIPEWRH